MTRVLATQTESWPLREVFRISRGARTHAQVVTVEIRDGEFTGRGECVPYARYGESVDSVLAQMSGVAGAIASGIEGAELGRLLPAGAARNALDCALWDLRARRSGVPAWKLAGLDPARPVTTAYTLSLDTADRMRAAARLQAQRAVLKIKLDAEDVLARIEAVRSEAPAARLIVDANEAWRAQDLRRWMPALKDLGVDLLEQPLPAGEDAALAQMAHLVRVAADESCHVAADVPELADRYDVVNVKLDKTGGLTEAIELVRAARDRGLAVMVGCMVSTSLSIAPAMLLAMRADYVDLDGPLLLASDREGGVVELEGCLQPPSGALWGGGG